jgi:hypothetical protein
MRVRTSLRYASGSLITLVFVIQAIRIRVLENLGELLNERGQLRVTCPGNFPGTFGETMKQISVLRDVLTQPHHVVAFGRCCSTVTQDPI